MRARSLRGRNIRREPTKSERQKSWLTTERGLDETIIDALLEAETRPRCLETGEGILLVLRGINLNPDVQFEDMVLIAYLGNNIGVVIESLDESIDQFEVATGVSASSASHGELGDLRRKTAYMRRFLAPQRGEFCPS